MKKQRPGAWEQVCVSSCVCVCVSLCVPVWCVWSHFLHKEGQGSHSFCTRANLVYVSLCVCPSVVCVPVCVSLRPYVWSVCLCVLECISLCVPVCVLCVPTGSGYGRLGWNWVWSVNPHIPLGSWILQGCGRLTAGRGAVTGHGDGVTSPSLPCLQGESGLAQAHLPSDPTLTLEAVGDTGSAPTPGAPEVLGRGIWRPVWGVQGQRERQSLGWNLEGSQDWSGVWDSR